LEGQSDLPGPVPGRRSSRGLMAISRHPRHAIKLIALLALAIGLLGTTAALVRAELSASGSLFVTFSGGISPGGLPRHSLAPISVGISGKVRTLSGEHPPALRRISIALNHDGHLDTHGLPTCPIHQIEATSSAQALAICGDALIGSGRFVARSELPEQTAVSVRGKILAFNSTGHGHPTILAHTYSGSPVPSSRIIVFDVRHTSGEYGTVLTGSLPPALNRWGYVKRIRLKLHRLFTYHGASHSYLSANCPAPRGLGKASFKFAHASMTFADGRTLSTTLTRTCSVQEGAARKGNR
jgi:hypothetical protein